MNRTAPVSISRRNPLAGGGRQERAVLAALIECQGRIVGRRELSRRAGIAELSERRCDSLLVTIRRQLGPSSIVTVRRRGWMLAEHAIDAATALLADSDFREIGDLADLDDTDFEEFGERAS
jgi:DNA-binding winged helix-turn-helix (wHTH) protein